MKIFMGLAYFTVANLCDACATPSAPSLVPQVIMYIETKL